MKSWFGALVALVALAAFDGRPARAQAGDITGIWLTEDGEGSVEITACGQMRCGRIVWIRQAAGAASPLLDARNPDPALRTRPLCHLQVLRNLSRQSDGRWGGGEVYDPDEGKTWSVIVARDGDALRVTGYLGNPLLGETQRWTRAPPGRTSCR